MMGVRQESDDGQAASPVEFEEVSSEGVSAFSSRLQMDRAISAPITFRPKIRKAA